MNWDIVEGKWEQFKGQAQQQWGKITDDELDVIAGKKQALAGKIQEKYGHTREQAEQMAEDWKDALNS